MIKNLLIIMCLSVVAYACVNNNGQEKEEQQESVVRDTTELLIAGFTDNAGKMVGELVVIDGTVDHVCHHGGERMFVIDEGTDERVKVVVGEGMPSFDVSLEGKDIEVIGVIDELRVDNDYLDEWESELNRKAGESSKNVKLGQEHESRMGEKADQGEHIKEMEKIKSMRKELKESGKDHLSFYSVVCEEYKIKE